MTPFLLAKPQIPSHFAFRCRVGIPLHRTQKIDMADSTTTTSVADPHALIEQLRVLTSTPSAYFESEAQKREFQSLIRGATAAIEEPFETMQRLVYGVSLVT